MSVGMAEVFHNPVPPSIILDVLMIVAARKTRLKSRSARGNVSHSQWTAIKVVWE
jgi:hypothetical protein